MPCRLSRSLELRPVIFLNSTGAFVSSGHSSPVHWLHVLHLVYDLKPLKGHGGCFCPCNHRRLMILIDMFMLNFFDCGHVDGCFFYLKKRILSLQCVHPYGQTCHKRYCLVCLNEILNGIEPFKTILGQSCFDL